MAGLLGKVSRAEIEAAADPRMEAYDLATDLLLQAEWEALTPRQRTVFAARVYDDEINNGGHLQYFHNRPEWSDAELLAALDELGARAQRDIFAKASAYEAEHPVEFADSLDEYHEMAMEQAFREYDEAYYACRPELGDELLPAFVEAHLGDFVEVE